MAALKGIAASLEGIGEIDDTGALLLEPVLEEVLAGCDVPPFASRLAASVGLACPLGGSRLTRSAVG